MSTPPLPAGYALDNLPPIPPGYSRDAAVPSSMISPPKNDSAKDSYYPSGINFITQKAQDALDKLREIENFTQEGKQAHPIQAKIGELANQLEGFTFGTSHGEAAIGTGQYGMATNPITAGLTPGAEGTPAAFSAAESAGSLIKSGAKAIKNAIPSASRAGANFQELESVIGKHPVEVTDDLSKSLNDIRKSVQTTNTNIPPVVRKLMDRVDSLQGGGPLTYEEARAFSSELGNLAASDKMSMTSNTQRLVTKVSLALKDSVQNTADLAGRGEQLAGAMKEYHNAMRVRNLSDEAKAALWKAALTSAGVYGLKKIWDAAQ